MDADAIVKFEGVLAGVADADLPTLLAMQQSLAGRVIMAQARQRALLREAGWRENPPGLVCTCCGGPTWGKEQVATFAKVEMVRCINPLCKATRMVMV